MDTEHIVLFTCRLCRLPGQMTTLAGREQLYAHHLRCPDVKCRQVITTEILCKYGLLNDKLKSLCDNALYTPPSQGAGKSTLALVQARAWIRLFGLFRVYGYGKYDAPVVGALV